MSNLKLLTKWATGLREGKEVRAPKSSNILIEGRKVYSYGLHWVLAQYHDGKVIVNNAPMSSASSSLSRLVSCCLLLKTLR